MIQKINSENFVEEIEKILKEENILSAEGMVYEGSNINSLPISGGKEEIKTIIRNYAMIFQDDKYYYVVMNDANLLSMQGRHLSVEQRKLATDFSVDKLKKAHYAFLEEMRGDNK